jgi:hypothetical protein
MTEMAATADGVDDLREMGAFEDPDNDRIVAVSGVGVDGGFQGRGSSDRAGDRSHAV